MYSRPLPVLILEGGKGSDPECGGVKVEAAFTMVLTV